MIDVSNEKLIPLRELARMIPGRNGKPIAFSTVWRWALNGRRGHRLPTIQVGGGRYTTAQWWSDFLTATNRHIDQTTTDCTVSDGVRQEQIDRELDREGI
jgi:Protein of unknown function (DUF1580)